MWHRDGRQFRRRRMSSRRVAPRPRAPSVCATEPASIKREYLVSLSLPLSIILRTPWLSGSVPPQNGVETPVWWEVVFGEILWGLRARSVQWKERGFRFSFFCGKQSSFPQCSCARRQSSSLSQGLASLVARSPIELLESLLGAAIFFSSLCLSQFWMTVDLCFCFIFMFSCPRCRVCEKRGRASEGQNLEHKYCASARFRTNLGLNGLIPLWDSQLKFLEDELLRMNGKSARNLESTRWLADYSKELVSLP